MLVEDFLCHGYVVTREAFVFCVLHELACISHNAAQSAQAFGTSCGYPCYTYFLENELSTGSSTLLPHFTVDIYHKVQQLNSLNHLVIDGLILGRGLDFEPASFSLGPYHVCAICHFAVREACHVPYLDVRGVIRLLEDCGSVN